MLGATLIARRTALVGEAVYRRLENLLKTLWLPVRIKGLKTEKIMAAMKLDKKVRGQKLRLVLPETIGAVAVFDDLDPAPIKKTIEALAVN